MCPLRLQNLQLPAQYLSLAESLHQTEIGGGMTLAMSMFQMFRYEYEAKGK